MSGKKSNTDQALGSAASNLGLYCLCVLGHVCFNTKDKHGTCTCIPWVDSS